MIDQSPGAVVDPPAPLRATGKAARPPDQAPLGPMATAPLRVVVALVVGVLVAAAMCLLARGSVAAVVAGLGVMVLSPGLGLWSAVGLPSGPRRVTTILLAGCAWTVCVGLWSASTVTHRPVLLFVVSAAPGLAGAATRLVRSRAGRAAGAQGAGDRPPADTPEEGVAVTSPTSPGPRSASWPNAVAVGCLVVSAGLAAATLVVRRDQPVGAYGLLPVLGAGFIVAVALAAVTVVVGALVSRVRTDVVLGGLAVLCAQFTLPPAVFARNLLGGWNYKHLGVVDLLAVGRPLDDPRDLFQSWPGFFASAADLVSVSGRNPVSYANFATAFFYALAGCALYSAAATLYPGQRGVRVMAVAIFLTTGWGGQMYYAPQSTAFAMTMLLLATVLPAVVARPAGPSWRFLPARLVRWAARGAEGSFSEPPGSVRVGRAAVAAAGAGFVAIVTVHQLTPYLLLLSLTPLVAAGWLPRRWQVGFVAAGLVTFGYLVVHHAALGDQSVISGFSLSNAQGGVTGPTSTAQQLASTGARGIAVVVWGGTALCVLTYLRRPGVVVVPTVLAALPLALVLVQNYGGEAIYRVWLFSSPWCAVVIAKRIADAGPVRSAATALLGLACTATLLLSAQATNFGMYPMLFVSSEETAASTWFYRSAPTGSTLVLAEASFPQRITHDYVDHDPDGGVNEPNLTDDPDLEGAGLDRMTAAQLAAYVTTYWGPTTHVAISRSMQAENDYYGSLVPGTLTRLGTRLTASPLWRVAYRNADATIFALRPGSSTSAPRQPARPRDPVPSPSGPPSPGVTPVAPSPGTPFASVPDAPLGRKPSPGGTAQPSPSGPLLSVVPDTPLSPPPSAVR